MKILVVEENIIVRKKIKLLLQSNNYYVKIYSNVNYIFDGLFKEYDLYIIGFRFNEYTGLEIISYIKSIHNNANVILLLTNTDLNIKKNLLETIEKIVLPLEDYKLLNKIDHIKHNSIFELINGLTYDSLNRNLYSFKKNRIKLTKKETSLFHLLATNLGDYISKEQIELYVFKGNNDITELDEVIINTSTMRGLIFRLRKKLPLNTILTETSRDSYFIPLL